MSINIVVKIKRFFLICCLLGTVVPVWADSVAGMYTSLRYNKEDGQLAGMEIFIFPGKFGYKALVQVAQGGRFHALVDLKTEKNDIEFNLPADTPFPGAHFVGKIEREALFGHFTDSQLTATDDEKLKRGKSFWQ